MVGIFVLVETRFQLSSRMVITNHKYTTSSDLVSSKETIQFSSKLENIIYSVSTVFLEIIIEYLVKKLD